MKLMKRNIPVQILRLLENMLFICHSCVKWENMQSAFFTVAYGVRQGSVFAPFLFAVYLDDLCEMCGFDRGRFIIVYADDILLLCLYVTDLEKLVHLCVTTLLLKLLCLCNIPVFTVLLLFHLGSFSRFMCIFVSIFCK